MAMRDRKSCVLKPLLTSAAVVLLLAGSARAANNLDNNGGPTMQNPIKAFLIYWLPSGVVLDNTVAGNIGNFETLTQRFFRDASASSYFNINTQYPGQCGSNQCVVANGPGAVSLGGAWVDTQAYPHGPNTGTQSNPLQDSDIQNEVTRAIAQNHWTANGNAEFFVITGIFQSNGSLVQECDGGQCTFNTFCAYHDNFNGGNTLYAYLTDVSFNAGGCSEGLSTATNGQIASDREVAVMSHEFFETVTDPQINAWIDNSTGNEIGDNCNQIPATVTMNGNKYSVQQQWSNAASSCQSSFGPSVQYSIGTGGDDLRGDSSAVAALQGPSGNTFENVTLKTQSQSGWGNNSGHIVVNSFNQSSSTALGKTAVTLTSHNGFLESDDNWNIQSLKLTLFTPSGGIECQQALSGNPLARLTGSAGTGTFGIPNCQPPIPPAATFNQISFNLTTGGDDLRGDSSATASIVLPSGTQTFTLKAQNGGDWENNSDHVVNVAIAGPALQVNQFGAITITLTSHNGTFESDDNWNLQNANITVIGSSGSACIINQAGNPLARLTGSGPSVTLHPRTGC